MLEDSVDRDKLKNLGKMSLKDRVSSICSGVSDKMLKTLPNVK